MTKVSGRATEQVLEFDVAGDACLGILHEADSSAALGVVLVVGGPQYRVGSHRQFVLLARALATAGMTTLRFDYRGMGDSAGEARDFTAIDADIRAAVDTLVRESGVSKVVIWGLCDAASAALKYAATDRRVAGLVLLNPWVHSPATEAQVRLKSYYLSRLRSPELWRKLLRFEFDWRDSLASLRGYLGAAMVRTPDSKQEHFITRMRKGWAAFDGPSLLILSGDDLTAGEFRQLAANDAGWRATMASKRIETLHLEAANHTFARAEWRDAVAQATVDWTCALSKDIDHA